MYNSFPADFADFFTLERHSAKLTAEVHAVNPRNLRETDQRKVHEVHFFLLLHLRQFRKNRSKLHRLRRIAINRQSPLNKSSL